MFEESTITKTINEYLNDKFPSSTKDEKELVEVYSEFEDEYNAIKFGVGIRNVSDENLTALYGKESLEFLHRISTNSVKDLEHYHHINTLFTNSKGRLIARAKLIQLDDFLLIVSGRNEEKYLKNWIERYIIMEKIKADDVNSRYFQFEVCGPQAESFLTLFAGKVMDTITSNNVVKVTEDSLRFYVVNSTDCDKIKKFRVFGLYQDFEKVLDAFLNGSSIFDAQMIGEKAYHTLRIENGIPVYPNEINDNFNPHENKLIHEVDFEKGCYIGQEVIARLDSYDKVQREMKGVVIEANRMPSVPLKVMNGTNKMIGMVTSATYSLKLNKYIGLVVIKKDAYNKEMQLTASNEEESYNISITSLPFRKL